MTTAAEREQYQMQARADRAISAQRAECIAIQCPKCNAGPGVRCNGRIARKSARQRLVGFHAERYEAAFPPQRQASEPTAPSVSDKFVTEPPKAPKPQSLGMGSGPLNATEFPFFERRVQEAIYRRAETAGNYLATRHDHLPKPRPRIKYRPYAAAALKVSIGPNAWAEIKRLVQAAQGANEIGGALLGFAYPWSDTVHVTRALPPAASAVYGAHSIDGHIDRAAITQILNEGPQGLQVVGAHHSHCTGDTELSGADMQAMADNRLVAGIKNPIELVVTSKAGSWSQLLTQVWMLTDTDDRAYDLDIKVADTTRPLS